jgi:hypothetical protein
VGAFIGVDPSLIEKPQPKHKTKDEYTKQQYVRALLFVRNRKSAMLA